MIKKNQVVLALIGIASLVLSPALSSNVTAEKAISPTVLKDCEKLYLKYRELGAEAFRAQYSYRAIYPDCIKLYKDPNWTFPGKEKLDSYFDKIDKAKSNSNLGKSDLKTVKIIQKLKTTKDKYFIKFQACAAETGIAKPSFLIETNIEKFIGKSSKNLLPNKCLSYSVEALSTSSDAIKLKFINDGAIYQGLKVKTI
ncbi:MAG TPA: hypothetical protein VD731_02220 [Nitrosopumilaceae archaeon]|nr:hypothetical protein [Nitrosopumilaceae archaeon]